MPWHDQRRPLEATASKQRAPRQQRKHTMRRRAAMPHPPSALGLDGDTAAAGRLRDVVAATREARVHPIAKYYEYDLTNPALPADNVCVPEHEEPCAACCRCDRQSAPGPTTPGWPLACPFWWLAAILLGAAAVATVGRSLQVQCTQMHLRRRLPHVRILIKLRPRLERGRATPFLISDGD